MKNIVILGSTGSIGENTLQVIDEHPDLFRVVGIAVRTQAEKALGQALRFQVPVIAVEDEAAAARIADSARTLGIKVLSTSAGVTELAAMQEADVVVCALVGLAGLRPTLAAIEAGHDVALATKEVLVSAGELVMARRAACGVSILPVDSEHSAIFQALQSAACDVACARDLNTPPSRFAEARIARLQLTASGGPFALHPEIDFATVTPDMALKHPRWSMGRKVTIDSATMMNKGLEILEAQWLFNVPAARIDVVVHPQSIVHSLVAFHDGSTLAQLSDPDMRLPIQYALTWPDRVNASLRMLDLIAQGHLDFSAPDESRFVCLRLAREVAARGGTMPAVLNAADEIAVAAFLQERIRFTDIPRIVEKTLDAFDNLACASLENVLMADAEARRIAAKLVQSGGVNA